MNESQFETGSFLILAPYTYMRNRTAICPVKKTPIWREGRLAATPQLSPLPPGALGSSPKMVNCGFFAGGGTLISRKNGMQKRGEANCFSPQDSYYADRRSKGDKTEKDIAKGGGGGGEGKLMRSSSVS